MGLCFLVWGVIAENFFLKKNFLKLFKKKSCKKIGEFFKEKQGFLKIKPNLGPKIKKKRY